jgi:hypothetical protein
VTSGVAACNDLNNDLSRTIATAEVIIDNLQNDLDQLGEADRDLQERILQVNSTYHQGERLTRDNFLIAEVTLQEALQSVVIITLILILIDRLLSSIFSGARLK